MYGRAHWDQMPITYTYMGCEIKWHRKRNNLVSNEIKRRENEQESVRWWVNKHSVLISASITLNRYWISLQKPSIQFTTRTHITALQIHNHTHCRQEMSHFLWMFVHTCCYFCFQWIPFFFLEFFLCCCFCFSRFHFLWNKIIYVLRRSHSILCFFSLSLSLSLIHRL